jgi:hypothetical protein
MSRGIASCLVVLALAGSAWAAPTKEEAAEDHKWLTDTWAKYDKAFEAVPFLVGPNKSTSGVTLYVSYGGDSMLLSVLVKIEPVDADWKKIVERLDAMKTRYGTDDSRSVAMRIARAEQGLALEAKPVAKGYTTNRDARTGRFKDRSVKDKEEAKKRAARAVMDELSKEGAFTVPDAKVDEVVAAIAKEFSGEAWQPSKSGHQYAGNYSVKAVVAAVEQILGVTHEAPDNAAADKAVLEAHTGLKKGVAELPAKRKEIAENLVLQVDLHMKNYNWVYYSMVEKQMALAARVNPHDDVLKARVAKFGEEIKKHKADNGKEIDKQEWPKHRANFDGPGKAEDLAAKGLEFLKAGGREVEFRLPRADPKNYEKGKFLAVTVTDLWEVVKESFGRVLIWGLRCYVAVTDDEMEKDGIAAVYQFRFSPAEGADRNTAWQHATGGTGDPPHHYMRISKLPK